MKPPKWVSLGCPRPVKDLGPGPVGTDKLGIRMEPAPWAAGAGSKTGNRHSIMVLSVQHKSFDYELFYTNMSNKDALEDLQIDRTKLHNPDGHPDAVRAGRHLRHRQFRSHRALRPTQRGMAAYLGYKLRVSILGDPSRNEILRLLWLRHLSRVLPD